MESEMLSTRLLNPTLLTDSYKLGHHRMYPEDTRGVFSYFESRHGAVFHETVFFGLQYLLYKYLRGSVVEAEDVDNGEEFCCRHFMMPGMFNTRMWRHILDKHEGRLPVVIKAVQEGTPVPTGNALMTIENTDPECAPLVSHLETMLVRLWYPCTVATISRHVKKVLGEALVLTSDKMGHLPFMLHDFGARGTSSTESAEIGGMAHLVNFQGSDTVSGVIAADAYYGAGMAGFSVPASEHSIMTAEGREGEMNVVERLLTDFPEGILSVVSDSYDIFKACQLYATRFKDLILNRKGKFVVRPDSGDPVWTITSCLKIFEEHFGSRRNSKGFKMLPPSLGMLWGDGLDVEAVYEIMGALRREQWAADTMVFGMGGGLLQKHNRDTQRFAFKASAINIKDQWTGVGKAPIGAVGTATKQSKMGRLKLIKTVDGFRTVTEDASPNSPNELCEVFRDGKITRKTSFSEVRRAACLREYEPEPK